MDDSAYETMAVRLWIRLYIITITPEITKIPNIMQRDMKRKGMKQRPADIRISTGREEAKEKTVWLSKPELKNDNALEDQRTEKVKKAHLGEGSCGA